MTKTVSRQDIVDLQWLIELARLLHHQKQSQESAYEQSR
jgi:hypothetical protein